MDIAEDLRRVALQEQRLQFDSFDANAAWALGLAIRTAGQSQNAGIVVDIRLYSMRLLSFALPGSAPENFDWARRKRNVVFHFHRSSYAIGLKMALDKTNLQGAWALEARDYASHGGSFPINLRGAGCIGAVTVSGLPQREDHRIVVEALATVLGQDLGEMALD
jgi:uncharacterized protein (UPF0303 family)